MNNKHIFLSLLVLFNFASSTPIYADVRLAARATTRPDTTPYAADSPINSNRVVLQHEVGGQQPQSQQAQQAEQQIDTQAARAAVRLDGSRENLLKDTKRKQQQGKGFSNDRINY